MVLGQKGRLSYAPWIKDTLLKAGRSGVCMTDLFKELKEGQDIYKTDAVYNSFARFFFWYEQLGYVEFTGRTETSYTKGREEIKEAENILASRKYFRITPKGRTVDWSNPLAIMHPQWATGGERKREYMREYMKGYRRRRKLLLRSLGYQPRPRGRPPTLALPS